MKVIILAGGGGTRLFPLSRTNFPKQFLRLNQDKSLLAETIQRFRQVAAPQDILVVTNKEYVHHVKTELVNCGAESAHILLEPVARNTAPAIALAARYCLDKLGSSQDEILFISPADHVIEPNGLFSAAVRKADSLASNGCIVTFGVRPDKPETGYGYIQAGEPLEDGFKVAAFREKPDQKTAQEYVDSGIYYWNSGMFCASIACLEQEMRKYQPEIAKLGNAPFEELAAKFEVMPNISIDYAIAEKSDRVAMIPLTCSWNDIGSWDAIYDVMDKDERGNALKGDIIPIDCHDSLLIGRDRLIAGIGLQDVLVVETDDVIVVAKKGESQKVKDLVSILKTSGRKEADEHTTTYRPWGSYTVLGEGPGYKMKKIVVNQGERLSLQMHYHRSEHWIVIGGTAKVTIDEDERMVQENESVFIPIATKHRLENPGRLPLEIIEVQNGKYLEEDDIVRFDDIYGRV